MDFYPHHHSHQSSLSYHPRPHPCHPSLILFIVIIPSSSLSHHPHCPIILIVPSSPLSHHPHCPIILVVPSSSTSHNPHGPIILISSQPVSLLSLCLIIPLIFFPS